MNHDSRSETPSAAKLSKRRSGLTLIELLIVIVILGLALLLIPAQRQPREAARRSQCKNNLKQIALAMSNYVDTYGAFPPAYTVDSNGRPLHSWRSLILPYMDQVQLYKKIDFSKAWDDPANAEALNTPIQCYRCPSADIPRNHTIYLAIVGPECCLSFPASKTLSEITDGTSNTLLVTEVPKDNSVPWMAPVDADQSLLLAVESKSKLAHSAGVQAVLADGSVRFLSDKMPPETRRGLTTVAGKEPLGDF